MSWKHNLTALIGAVALGQLGNATAADITRMGTIQEVTGSSLIVQQQAYRLADRTVIHLPSGETDSGTSALTVGTRIRLRAEGVQGNIVPRVEEIWIITD